MKKINKQFIGKYEREELADSMQGLAIPSTAYSIFPQANDREYTIIALTLVKPMMDIAEEFLLGIGFKQIK